MEPSFSPGQSPRFARAQGLALAVLVIVLAVFACFFPALGPTTAVFSNDGPLGANAAEYAHVPAGWFGFWQDLNWLGGSVGAAAPSFTYGILWLLNPVGYAKFYQPICLILLGASAALLCFSLNMRRWVCLLAGLAAAFNSDLFSYTCWGLGSHALAVTALFLALAALAAGARLPIWARLLLGGFAVGLSVMEGFDSGAILSLYASAFVVAQAWWHRRTPGQGVAQGLLQVGVVAFAAVWIAAYTVSSLVGTQIKGVVGMEQDPETKARRWVEATQWSLPRSEVLRVVVPGLFGYRMDTPEGGNYWGAVGRHPVWDEYLALRNPDPQRQPDPVGLRHSGAGFYAGVFVVFMALFSVVQAMRSKDGPFGPEERRWVFFWLGAAAVSLVLALGRHAPLDLYRWTVYQLPYFSTIRNPIKFLHPFSLSVVILCAYGLEALWRRLEQVAMQKSGGGLGAWWSGGPAFERTFARFTVLALGAAFLALLVYASSRSQDSLVNHLRQTGFDDEGFARKMAKFSLKEAGWSVLFLALSVGSVFAVLAGMFRGKRASLGAGLLLGVVLLADLYRANTPWIVFYDYKVKYASNPVIEELRVNAHERRVSALFLNAGPESLRVQRALQELYSLEWMQHLFPFYNIPSLDIVQMPRMDTETAQFKAATAAHPLRLWELTSTRYILGLAAFVEPLNKQLDAGRGRFRIRTPFELQPGPAGGPATALTNATGPYAIMEFQGALPKASLYARWEVIPEAEAALKRVVDPAFDPAAAVVVDAPPGFEAGPAQSTGTVRFVDYTPKRMRLASESSSSSVLLLNDKFHPDWKVYLDGKPALLLRCNYIMRGLAVPAGSHEVEFRFQPSTWALYVSLSAIGLGIILCAWLVILGGRRSPGEGTAGPGAASTNPA